MDCWDEPHWRSTVVPGTDSGQPAPSTAIRATLRPCWPTCWTQPQITSSTTAGSKPFRVTSAVSTWAERSTAWNLASEPFRLPTGVRTASTITASRADMQTSLPKQFTYSDEQQAVRGERAGAGAGGRARRQGRRGGGYPARSGPLLAVMAETVSAVLVQVPEAERVVSRHRARL